MITPARRPDGDVDNSRIADWAVACDGPGCDARRPFNKVSRWCVGKSLGLNVYCPRCERRIARDLIRSVFPRQPRLRVAVAVLGRLGRKLR